VSRKHTTGQAGKGRPTPPRPSKGTSRATATRSSGRARAAGPVYRSRRTAPLPAALKIGLVLVWLAALAAVLSLIDPWTARIGAMIVVTFVLVLFVVLVFNPARRGQSRRR
jgi:hypothetical protein